MIAMSERCRCEHHQDEKTIQHPIENSDQICLCLMTLIQCRVQIQKRKSTRTLNSYWMKFFDEQRMQRRWFFFETQYMKTDLFPVFVNILQKIKIEKHSEFRYMTKTIRLFETDLSKQMMKLKDWMNEFVIQTESTHHLNQKDADCEVFHSIRTICWFRMYYDSTSSHVIWFSLMKIAETINSTSFKFELIQPWVKKNEATNMQSTSRDSYETEYTILNQSDWTEKKKTSERLQMLCFSNIKDTMRKKWLLKLLHIKQSWKMCSSVCEWMCKNTKQSKTKQQDFLKNKYCSKTRKCILRRDIETMFWLNSCFHSRTANTMTESTQCFCECNNKTRVFLFLHSKQNEKKIWTIFTNTKSRSVWSCCVWKTNVVVSERDQQRQWCWTLHDTNHNVWVSKIYSEEKRQTWSQSVWIRRVKSR